MYVLYSFSLDAATLISIYRLFLFFPGFQSMLRDNTWCESGIFIIAIGGGIYKELFQIGFHYFISKKESIFH